MSSCKGHLPIRTCISCRTKKNKRDLIRLVLDSRGRVVEDKAGNKPGRGVYVCKNVSCIERLVEDDRIKKAFRKECHMSIKDALLAIETQIKVTTQ